MLKGTMPLSRTHVFSIPVVRPVSGTAKFSVLQARTYKSFCRRLLEKIVPLYTRSIMSSGEVLRIEAISTIRGRLLHVYTHELLSDRR